MCGIAGCYQQTDGEFLVRLMSDRIAHRGPDADGLYCLQRLAGERTARSQAAVDHRSQRSGRPTVHERRADHLVQRRALQLQGDPLRACSLRSPVPHDIRHRGGARSLAEVRDRCTPTISRHVRVRRLRREDGQARHRPRPDGDQAALLDATTRRDRLRVRAEGDRRRGRKRAHGRLGDPRRLDALLLGAGPALLASRSAEASAGLLARDLAGRHDALRALLLDARTRRGGFGRRARGSAQDRRGVGHRSPRSRCPVCRAS